MKNTKHCAGCHNNFYNLNNMGMNMKSGSPQCWSLEDAKLTAALDVPVNLTPPYTNLREIKRPSCYKAQGYVRVPKANLTKG